MKAVAYEIGQTVRLKESDISAKVESILFDLQGVSYKLRYWRDGERYTVWVFPDEIDSA